MNGTQDSDYEKTAVVTADVDVTQAMTAPGVEATTMSANVECPVCRTANPPSETYCIDCGFLLGDQPAEVEAVPEVASVGALVTPDGTREFALRLGENTVGRENADILISHNSVSRRHAKIIVEEGRALVEDAGSTNGTCVDGAKIEPGNPTELKDGAEVLFGSAALTYRAPSPQPSPQGEGEIGEGEAPAEPEEATSPQPSPSTSSGCTQGEGEIGEGEAPAEPVFRLVSKDGSVSFGLAPGVYKIGRRQDDNDLAVPDAYASGRHADLTVSETEISITDVGSSNGTLVNCVRIEANTPCELNPGDEVAFGQTYFTLEAI